MSNWFIHYMIDRKPIVRSTNGVGSIIATNQEIHGHLRRRAAIGVGQRADGTWEPVLSSGLSIVFASDVFDAAMKPVFRRVGPVRCHCRWPWVERADSAYCHSCGREAAL
ncbi:MAG TPA: hypothetical protein VNG12_18580 [Acidimicrobiales bacterium]|nr:hypothetical protein [Acidimicrobiales bacterium]